MTGRETRKKGERDGDRRRRKERERERARLGWPLNLTTCVGLNSIKYRGPCKLAALLMPVWRCGGGGVDPGSTMGNVP